MWLPCDIFLDPQEKQLVLLYENEHYDVITSLPAYFKTSYVCAHCFKPYDHEGQQACKNNMNHCPACLRTGSPDYAEARCHGRRASIPCGSCKLLFNGDTCVDNHLNRSYNGKPADAKNISVCTQCCKCQECKKILVGLGEHERHLCGHKSAPVAKSTWKLPCTNASYKLPKVQNKSVKRNGKMPKELLGPKTSLLWHRCRVGHSQGQ